MNEKYFSLSQLKSISRIETNQWSGPSEVCDLYDLKKLPPADVRPVVRGEWLKSPECPEEYDICSVCGLNDKHRSRGNAEHPALESIPPFCKWCGADMREDTHNPGDLNGYTAEEMKEAGEAAVKGFLAGLSLAKRLNKLEE